MEKDRGKLRATMITYAKVSGTNHFEILNFFKVTFD